MPSINARTDIYAATPAATRDHEDARVLWTALLPTWTDPSAARLRNMSRLVAALRNPRALALVADTLEKRYRSRKGVQG